ncbi:hypothetical protein [Ectobacillus panaciterrae]
MNGKRYDFTESQFLSVIAYDDLPALREETFLIRMHSNIAICGQMCYNM